MALHRWLRRLWPALLLGWASLVSATPSPEEHLRIQALIQRVEKSTSMSFLRNGTAHTAAEAAEHMQAKYAHFKNKIATAEDFVDLCASRSEMSGKPYMVKMGDAAPVEAGTFLKDELRTLRKAPAP
ncbi:DUF5329 family protein [Variovorax guangxiensis]|uniref:DUF5329 domain-containing protein n=1 Tax=Variovorax guangxiensis TaxID=1775474 RepID=A0A502DWR8_9BURK|nr:DUF5329 family protein [Variovorax guangxiensis]TPG24350.1 hypothetical protein EAH83_07630 [Variovorax ginsengisoli]TPG28600.1 hypothetical protein EAH82_07290 [Variovorax guangxiensis]